MTLKQAFNKCSRSGHVPMEVRGEMGGYNVRTAVTSGEDEEDDNIVTVVADIRICTRCGLQYDAMVELEHNED